MTFRGYLPAVRACVAIALLGLYPSIQGCSGEGEETEFPYSMTIAPGNVLFVQGHEYHGEVWVTWEPGDSVRIDGYAVLPTPKSPPKQLSDSILARTYGNVPSVDSLVEKGATWHEAVNQYESRVTAFFRNAHRVYDNVFEVTGSKSKATQAVLDSMDTDLLDPGHETRYADGTIIVKWEGLPCEAVLYLHNDYLSSKEPVHPSRRFDESEVQAFVKSVAMRLEGRAGGVWMDVFSSGHTTLGGREVKKALNQIENAEQGEPCEGPMPERDVDLIVRVKAGGQRR